MNCLKFRRGTLQTDNYHFQEDQTQPFMSLYASKASGLSPCKTGIRYFCLCTFLFDILQVCIFAYFLFSAGCVTLVMFSTPIHSLFTFPNNGCLNFKRYLCLRRFLSKTFALKTGILDFLVGYLIKTFSLFS